MFSLLLAVDIVTCLSSFLGFFSVTDCDPEAQFTFLSPKLILVRMFLRQNRDDAKTQGKTETVCNKSGEEFEQSPVCPSPDSPDGAWETPKHPGIHAKNRIV